MILAYLILAHLLGDFIFQPSKLVLWKMKSKKGILVHVLVHFILSSILLIPYLINGHLWLLIVAFGLSFVHFWIDEAKINFDLKNDEKVLPFLLDQLMHLLTIIVAYSLIQSFTINLPNTAFYKVYLDVRLTAFFAFIVFVTTVVEIFHFTRAREKNGATKLKIDTNKMLTRVIIFTFIYGAFIIASFYAEWARLL